MSERQMRHRRTAAVIVLAAMLDAHGQQPLDPEVALSKTRERLLADLERLPRYTCVQTITRQYYAPQSGQQRSSCASLMADAEKLSKQRRLWGWDRLRLEVAIANGSNVYSWVGASHFGESSFEKLAGQGPLASGDFGPFLHSILQQAKLEFREERVVNGKRLLEYSYDMPLGKSHYLVKSGKGWMFTAYSGTLLLDPEDEDIVQLAIRTAELPEGNPDCQANSKVEYGRTSIHDHMVLIPRQTRLQTLSREGYETLSVSTYASCREYASKSRVLPESPQASAGSDGVPAPAAAGSSIPAGLHFACRILTPLDSDTAAAGDPIEAVLRSPLRDKKKNVLAPSGSHVHGRLVRVDSRSSMTDYVRLGVELDSLEIGGRMVPFHAIPEPSYGSRVRGALEVLFDRPEDTPLFIFTGQHVNLQHLDWTWITLPSR